MTPAEGIQTGLCELELAQTGERAFRGTPGFCSVWTSNFQSISIRFNSSLKIPSFQIQTMKLDKFDLFWSKLIYKLGTDFIKLYFKVHVEFPFFSKDDGFKTSENTLFYQHNLRFVCCHSVFFVRYRCHWYTP